MARKPRVVIPENPGELLKLSGNVYKHSQELGAKSPLLILDEPTWVDLGPLIEPTIAVQVEIEEKERQLKELYGRRDPVLVQLTDANRRSRDLLLAKHSANPAALGPYGFDVLTSVAPGTAGKKPPKP